MTGFVFIVCVPTEDYEKYLRSNKKRVFIKETSRRVREKSLQGDVLRSADKSKDDDEFCVNLENSPNSKENYEYSSMQKLILDILNWYKIEKSASSHNIDEHYVQLLFAIEAGEKCEEILDILREHNVGQRYKSTISIIPCSLYYQGCETPDDTYTQDNLKEKKDVRDTAWTRFVSSVRARLTVAQIVEVVKTEAALTFDFICLLVIATILCAIGLVENNNVYLLSSMLISPMMGPVMAGTFGSVIRDRTLLKVGVQSELIGLGIATVVGFCYGAIICLCTDKYGETDWPTNEMISRGEIRILPVGCLIALLSGAAVAVGVLSDNIASLVGVAISTSLMPPAVNAGLLWSLASVYYLKHNETTRYAALVYTEYYSTDRFIELSSLGAVSLCLTFVNIICIYASGILVFKIKEVAPMSKDQARKQFWKHDIKVTRDYNKTLQKEDVQNIEKQLRNEIADYKKQQDTHESFHNTSEFSQDDMTFETKNGLTWSPCTIISKRPTIKELQQLYANIMRDKSATVNSPLLMPNRSHCRRLSQVFTQGAGELSVSARINEDININIPESSIGPSKRKFTVTPCHLDI